MEAAAIVILNLIFYARTIRYGLVIDDSCRKYHEKDLQKNPLVRLFRITRYSGYGGIPVWADHLLTILLHTAVAVSIYYVFGANNVSFWAAMLFSVHPVTNQVSIWLNGKRFAIMTLCMLWMYHFGLWGLPLYFLGFMWHYGVLPGVLILGKVSPLILLAMGLLCLISYKQIISRIGTRWERIPPGEIKRIRLRKLVLAVKIFGYVTLHCLFPRRMSFYHMFMERFGFSEEDNKYWYSFNKDFWVGVLTLLFLGGIWWVFKSTPLGFGIVWYCIFLSPWLSFPLGFTQAIADRVYYLPLTGLVLSMTYALSLMPYGGYVYLALLGWFASRLFFYQPAYRDFDNFYRYALHEFPDHFRARTHEIQRRLGENRVFWALYHCGVGLGYHPNDYMMNLLMTQSLMAIGAFAKAKEYLEKAEKLMVPGQERYQQKVINDFATIIDNGLKGQPMRQIKPDENREVSPVIPTKEA